MYVYGRKKTRKRLFSIYKDLKAGKEVQGFQEFRLPEDIQKLGEALSKRI